MGCCFSPESDPAKLRDEEIQRVMEAEQRKNKRTLKLLLLGAGESGKSTLFKQCQSLYGSKFKQEDYDQYIQPIHRHVFWCIKALCENCDTHGFPVAEDVKALQQDVLTWAGHGSIYQVTPRKADIISTLWADPGIQRAYENRSKFYLFDSAEYFLTRATQIAADDYKATYEDILRVRKRTTGVTTIQFKINGQDFIMYDVGGQQSERKKWIHSFENVNALLYVCAISGYDQMLFEDGVTNRMIESLNLFEEFVNTDWFEDTAVILFLNKRDLFVKKIDTVPLTVCFPEYKGDNSYDDTCKYVMAQFRSRLKNPNVQIYNHVTCATDKDQMMKVFKSVRDVVIRQVLKDHGFS